MCKKIFSPVSKCLFGDPSFILVTITSEVEECVGNYRGEVKGIVRAVILGWRVCSWSDSWWPPTCFIHESVVLCLAVASLKEPGVTAVGDQELLPVASSVSSVKTPVTVSFSCTSSLFSSEDLVAVICDNYMFLYLYFVSSLATAKSFDIWIPGQKNTYTSHPPKPHTGSS